MSRDKRVVVVDQESGLTNRADINTKSFQRHPGKVETQRAWIQFSVPVNIFSTRSHIGKIVCTPDWNYEFINSYRSIDATQAPLPCHVHGTSGERLCSLVCTKSSIVPITFQDLQNGKTLLVNQSRSIRKILLCMVGQRANADGPLIAFCRQCN